MSIKVIALGNVLMKDDGVAIDVARKIEKELSEKNIEVILGETDAQYCISKIKEEDYIFVIDAACYEKAPGEITCISLYDFVSNRKEGFQHSYSFLDLIKLYYPNIKGKIYGIEVAEVGFGLGLSCTLQNRSDNISKEILKDMEKIFLYEN
jgi:hydrogenase maturation protease